MNAPVGSRLVAPHASKNDRIKEWYTLLAIPSRMEAGKVILCWFTMAVPTVVISVSATIETTKPTASTTKAAPNQREILARSAASATNPRKFGSL